MNELTTFTNEEFGSVRTVTIDDEPWFSGKDVALALEYSNPQKAIRDHVDDDDRKVNDLFTVNGTALTLINESGLYCLIFSSKLPGAKRFKRWVTSEVLPALRKTGRYETQRAMPEREITKDDYLKAAQIVATCRNERLPYVFDFLKQAGITTQTVRDLLLCAHRVQKETGDLAAIQDFAERPVPDDWAKWPIAERRAYWRGEITTTTDGQDLRLVERDRICAREIWSELLGRNPNDLRSTDTRAINAILEHLKGWERNPNPLWFGPYNQQRGYLRIRDID